MPIGLTGFLGAGRETVWGTPVAAVRYAPLMSENLDPAIEHVGHDNVLGFGVSQQQSPVSGLRTVSGEIVFQSRPAFLGDMLRALLNSPISAALTVADTGASQDISVNATTRTFTRASGSFLTDGFKIGQTIIPSGYVASGNNAPRVIHSVTASTITVVNGAGLVTEAGTGNEQITASAGGIQHLYRPRNTPFAPETWCAPYTFEVFKGVGTQSHQFPGVVVDSMEFRWGAGNRLMSVSMNTIGKDLPTFITKTTPTVEDTLPFAWNQCFITLPDPTLFKQFSDLTLRITWGLRAESLIDGTSVIGVVMPDQLLSVELSGTAYPFTTDEYQEFIAQSERPAIITFVSDEVIGATNRYLLRFSFPRLRYSVYRYGLRGVGLIQAEITARSFYNVATTQGFEVLLQNGITSYEA
jgi:hypothetical protein